jgi:uncharacterized lipoprotein YajG
MTKLLVAIALLAGCATALAQLRTIPQDAKRAHLRHVQGMVVEIDGAEHRLAPGAQIRDATNLIVLPTAVPAGSLVKYRLGDDGMVRQVWILSPQEAAQRDAKP